VCTAVTPIKGCIVVELCKMAWLGMRGEEQVHNPHQGSRLFNYYFLCPFFTFNMVVIRMVKV